MTPLTPNFKRLIGAFSLLAIALYIVLNKLLPNEGQFWAAKLASLSIVPLLFALYVKVLWRLPIARVKGLLCDMPDLNGRWEGMIDRKDARGPHPHVIEVRQSLLTLSIRNFGDKSHSRAASAGLYYYAEDKSDCALIYAFHGETKNRRGGGLVKKRIVGTKGETRLSLLKGENPVRRGILSTFFHSFCFSLPNYYLQGDYSSDRTDTSEKVTGEIEVVWMQRQLKGKF